MSRPIFVLKIGGSFAHSPLLDDWLDLAERSAGRVAIVAGGGPFADLVRSEQHPMKFDDAAAHDMALLAMSQFARALVSRSDRFDFAASIPEIEKSLSSARVPVWSPWPMLRGGADIPMSWDVTSDSLSAWLATKLDAERLVIAKHTAGPDALDAAFPSFRARFRGDVDIVGPSARAFEAASTDRRVLSRA